jgi:Flp pilus assembly protein TadD
MADNDDEKEEDPSVIMGIVLRAKAKAYEAEGDLASAEKSLRRAAELGDREGASRLAMMLEQRGDHAGAEAVRRRAEGS